MGDRIDAVSIAQGKQAVTLQYSLPADSTYFTHPTAAWDGTTLRNHSTEQLFTYQIVAADGSGESAVQPHCVSIQNVNGPSALNFQPDDDSHNDGDVFTVTAVSFVGDDNPGAALELNGFSIIDADLGVDPIRVTVQSSSQQGLITLNTDALAALDFNSDRYCFSSPHWTCTGDGTLSTEMSFVAMPSSVQRALNGMRYESLVPDSTDTLLITLYDGQGGDCLTAAQLGAGSVRSGCFSSEIALEVKTSHNTHCMFCIAVQSIAV